METIEFIRSKFHEFYVNHRSQLGLIPQLQKREFGFIPLATGKKIMIRHKAFNNPEELSRFIEALVPSDAYYSSAFYRQPDAENMNAKEWEGAELMFDIDCDHIDTKCKRTHDNWQCQTCGLTGAGNAPVRCSKCKGEQFSEDKWVCDECLGVAKQELLKLITILEEDFAVSPNREMTIVFSGHRGYHLHVENEELMKIGSSERREISDYVTGIGIDISILSRLVEMEPSNTLPTPYYSVRWATRLTMELYSLLHKSDEYLKALGLSPLIIAKIREHKDVLLDAGPDSKLWKILSPSPSTLFKLTRLEEAQIDVVVTSDIHRLIRLPHTLHGRTALEAKNVRLNELPAFNPLRDAVTWSMNDYVKVKVDSSPLINIAGNPYGPFSNDLVSLPLPAALYLMCHGKATLQ